MPIPPPVKTGLLILGTIVTAVGLNLGVLGLNQDTPPTNASAGVETAQVGPEEVVLAAATAPAKTTTTESSLGQVTEASTTTDAESEHHDDGEEHHDADDHAADEQHKEGEQQEEEEERTTISSLGVHSTTATSSTTTSATAPSSTVGSTTAEAGAPTVAPVVTKYLTYHFGGVASIIVALHGGTRLEFWSATPEDGWAFRVDDDLPQKVKIKFRPIAGGDESEFELKLEDGDLKLKQEH